MALLILYDILTIIKKNILLETKSPLSILGQFLTPLTICFIVYSSHSTNSILTILLKSFLPFVLGNLSTSLMRKYAVYFIRQRQQGFGKHQRIMGLSTTGYVFGNLIFCHLFALIVISPVIAIFMYYQKSWILPVNFIAYILCSNCFFLLIVSFFSDAKLCSEVLALSCGVFSILYYCVDLQKLNTFSFMIMMLPQPAFALIILNNSKKALSMILLAAKIYVALFLYRQFNIHPLQKCKQCLQKCKKRQQLQIQIQQHYFEHQAKIVQQINYKRQKMLSLSNINKKYNNQTIINDLSLTIFKGQVLSLLGRNGAGKTTLINIISSIEKPSYGNVKFNNQSLKIGVCFQKDIFYQELTVEQTIKFYISIRKANQSQLLRVLQCVGIQQQLNKNIKQLSGGTKRKLSIAISIIGNPEILLLDEPTSSLDPESRKSIWNIINNFKRQSKTVILTTHNLDEAETLSDRVCVIQRGVSLVLGSPTFIKKRFGVGYILTIYNSHHSIVQEQQIIAKYISVKCQTRDQIMFQTMRQYLIQFKDQPYLIPIIQQLQKINNIEITLQVNSLENSMIQILKDTNLISPIDYQPKGLKSPVGQRKPFLAAILKTLYLIKRNPLKHLVLYNLNIIFLLFSIALTKSLAYFNFGMSIQNVINQQLFRVLNRTLLFQGYVFSLGVYIYNVVYQKQLNIISLLYVKGMSWIHYWLSQFLIQFCIFQINTILVYCILKDQSFDIFFVSIFGVSLILFSYLCSYLFSSSSKSIRFFPIINLIIASIFPLFGIIKNVQIKLLISALMKYTYPFYHFQQYLLQKEGFDFTVLPFIIQIFIMGLIITLIQTKIVSRFNYPAIQQQIQQAVRMQMITKLYGQNLAVDNISFSVKNSQILGLLGPNGAGKSTVFKMLTNQIQSTTGKIYLQNTLHHSYNKSFDHSSVCYQQNTLWQSLTGREILVIFAYLSGVQNIDSQIQYLVDKLQIPRIDKQFKYLSEGTKRKCCLATCLIGQPLYIYLDECSTGLDPISRRSMINLIRSHEDASMIFTTHSMNQVQNLCNKVLILCNGKMKQIGTVKQLRDVYCPFYCIQLFYNCSQQQIQKVLSEIGQTSTIQINTNEKIIKSKINKQNNSLSKLLNTFFKLKKQQSIKDFLIHEPKFEDVYLEIIK